MSEKLKNPIRELRSTHPILARVESVCLSPQWPRGIYKRIDENRELLRCLQQEAPELLERCSWIPGWIAGQDCFLVDLLSALGWQPTNFLGGGFPRPWPDSERWPASTQQEVYRKFTPIRANISECWRCRKNMGNASAPLSSNHCVRVIPSMSRKRFIPGT